MTEQKTVTIKHLTTTLQSIQQWCSMVQGALEGLDPDMEISMPAQPKLPNVQTSVKAGAIIWHLIPGGQGGC
jgi:hypothetical protein